MNSIFPIAEVSLQATGLDAEYFRWLTNSVLVAAIVTVVIIFLARRATAKMQLVPDARQNLFEALVEGLYTMLEGIVGKHLIGKTFSYLASLFIFILISNWFGLIPGVGSIGWGPAGGSGPLSLAEVTNPLFRPATADLNLTLGLAMLSMILWFIWTMQEVGVGGFIMHIFGPKGGMTGWMGKLLVPVFIIIGFLELLSIATRPVSLSLRLFGNIFAGENILTMMLGIGKEFGLNSVISFIVGLLATLPFFFLEVMVGLLQAFVFMLLVAVYIQLSTSHEGDAH